MGEIWFSGPKSLESLQWLTTNDVSKLEKGQAQYSLLPNDKGGLVDDIFIYCLEPGQEYLVCVNAANIEKDFEWMKAHNKGATIDNQSSKWAQIAIQGPKGRELTARIFGSEFKDLPRNQIHKKEFQGQSCYVACTSYTKEDSYKIFVPNENAIAL
jgi:aminomethyltransferase